MLINIDDIKINPGRRTAAPEDVQKLSESIAEVGMMNPITVTADHTLVAGLHRLEAARVLGWAEIECRVIDADDLHAELAEIDENYVRANLTPLESSKIMLRRKEIYETLHPETKAGTAQAAAMHRTDDAPVTDKLSITGAKPFAEDTADKLGVDARTVRRQVQIAKDVTPEAQEIIENSGAKVTQQNLLKLSRLSPEQQTEAAGQLVTGEINSVDEYGKEQPPAIERKKPGLDGGTIFMTEFAKFRDGFFYQMEQYGSSYDANFLELTDEQVSDLERQMDGMHAAMKKLLEQIKTTVAHADEILNGADEEETAEEQKTA